MSPNVAPPVTQFCTFWVDDLYVGVDVMQVQEVIREQPMTDVPLAPATVLGLINLRGQIVTAIDLRRRVGLAPRPDHTPMNVVVRHGDEVVSLLVDEIGDVVVPDPAEHDRVPPTVRGVARELFTDTYKLPDRLLLILDTGAAIAVDGAAHSSEGDRS